MSIVSNSWPLISLSRIGQLDLLHHLYGEIIVPEAVWQEVVVDGAGQPGAPETEFLGHGFSPVVLIRDSVFQNSVALANERRHYLPGTFIFLGHTRRDLKSRSRLFVESTP